MIFVFSKLECMNVVKALIPLYSVIFTSGKYGLANQAAGLIKICFQKI